MVNLSKIGRVFYGIAIAEIGLQAIYYHDFPYILSIPEHFWVSARIALALIFGIMFVLAGASILFEKKTRQVCLLFGAVLLLIFCFYYIPYEFLASSNYMHYGDWENAAKELSFAGGAFVIAGCFSEKNESPLNSFLKKLIPFGPIIFSITILSFGIDHYLYAKEAAGYVPSWVPDHTFCLYFTGTALLASAIAIILNVKRGLAALLLGAMIITWFVSLHIPRVIVSSAAGIGGEVTSAMLALAYGGIAFVIAGGAKKIV